MSLEIFPSGFNVHLPVVLGEKPPINAILRNLLTVYNVVLTFTPNAISLHPQSKSVLLSSSAAGAPSRATSTATGSGASARWRKPGRPVSSPNAAHFKESNPRERRAVHPATVFFFQPPAKRRAGTRTRAR